MDLLLGLRPQDVVSLRRKLEGKFDRILERCLLVPASIAALGISVIHRYGHTVFHHKSGSVSPKMGIFNLFFLMNWVQGLLGKVDTLVPLGGEKDELDGEGIMCLLNEEPEDFSRLYDIYSSDSKAVIPNQAPLWICSNAEGRRPSEFLVSSDGGQAVKLPKRTGYWKVVIENPHLDASLVDLYVAALKKAKFSYRFESKKSTLYFSNSLGASLGLPPSAKHLFALMPLGPEIVIGLECELELVNSNESCEGGILKGEEAEAASFQQAGLEATEPQFLEFDSAIADC